MKNDVQVLRELALEAMEILSWRPSPSSMISTGLDEDLVRKHMREYFEVFKKNDNYFDITLKDVETVNHHPENISRWV